MNILLRVKGDTNERIYDHFKIEAQVSGRKLDDNAVTKDRRTGSSWEGASVLNTPGWKWSDPGLWLYRCGTPHRLFSTEIFNFRSIVC